MKDLKLNQNTDKFSGKRVSFVKDEIKEWFSKSGKSDFDGWFPWF